MGFRNPSGFGGGITQLTGSVLAGPGDGSQVATLDDTGVYIGVIGSANEYLVIETQADGRLLAAVSGPISITSQQVTEQKTISQAVPVSGTAYMPSGAFPAEVTFQLNAAVAGSFTLTFGPATGAEYTVANAVAMLVGSDLVFTKHIPQGWKYILTATSVTIGTCTTEVM